MAKVFIDTCDIVESYLAAAEAADMVNEAIAAGDPPDTSCFCTDAMKQSEMHPCGNCLEISLCSSLLSTAERRWYPSLPYMLHQTSSGPVIFAGARNQIFTQKEQ